MAEIVGEIVAEIGPHCHVDVVLEVDEEMRQELVLALAVADVQVVIFVLVVDRHPNWTAGGLDAGVVQMEQQVVQLQNYQEGLRLKTHPFRYLN